ncbi:MAG: hypothetical protein ACRD2W_13845 [Acidimicrobiales bacterium]
MILDERSSAAPALAPGYLAWTGRDTRTNVLPIADGTAFGDKQTLDERSSRVDARSTGASVSESTRETVPLGPALAVLPGGGLNVAWTGTNGHLNVQGITKVTLDETSPVAPALCAAGGELVLAWIGTDRRLNVARSESGRFGPPVVLDETSDAAPALCWTGGNAVVAWTGTDRHLNVLTGDGRVFSAPTVLDERSPTGPALAPAAQGLAVGWTGGDRRVNLLIGDHKQVLDAKSSLAPALCAFDGQLLLAWTGTDHRVNVTAVA